MLNIIKNILLERGVELVAPVSLAHLKILRPYKLERAGFSKNEELTAIMLAVPYLTRQKGRNISAYAVPRDYHGFFKELFDSVIPELESVFPDNHFAGFADDSPINERDAAAISGLGIIGDNGMLITEKYSSYVFLGEIITNLSIPSEPNEIEHCRSCRICKTACPMDEIGVCLSALTQKKGELTEGEIEAIKKNGSAWGCDRCQEVCPHTLRAIKNETIYTNIDYFKQNTIPCITCEILDSMSDEEFAKRAYSWRKRETIRRNLEILKK